MNRETSKGCATVRQLCEAFGISRQAFYAARRGARPRPQGPDASALRPPRGTPVSELEPAIRELVSGHPAWGVRKIWACLRRQDLKVSLRRVWALMRSWNLTLPAYEPSNLRTFGHVVVPNSNRRWATDLTTTWTRRDGTVALVPVIDCGDRFLLACAVSKQQDSSAVLAPILDALVAEFGEPEVVPDGFELRSDHGPQYTGADCDEVCKRWNVLHTFAPVARPTGNAVAERLIETLKLELLWTRDWDSIDELRHAVAEWLHGYNSQRPHQALAWATPAERRASNLNLRLVAA